MSLYQEVLVYLLFFPPHPILNIQSNSFGLLILEAKKLGYFDILSFTVFGHPEVFTSL